MISNNIIETETVVEKLPFGLLKLKREIGFRFNIMAYAYMCELFTPKLDFWQTEELRLKEPFLIFKKLVHGAALSYANTHETKYKVKSSDVDYWLEKMPAESVQKFIDKINVAILNGQAKYSIEQGGDGIKKK